MDLKGENKNESIRFQYSKNLKESIKISKKVIISIDLLLTLAERKNGRSTQNFQIFIPGELKRVF